MRISPISNSYVAFSKRNLKKQTQNRHFNNACENRAGEVLDSKEITKQIQNGELEFLDRQSNKITRWKYNHNGKDYIIVYDKKFNQPVTIIPYREDYKNNNDKYWWLLSK